MTGEKTVTSGADISEEAYCPTCDRSFSQEILRCPEDGTKLVVLDHVDELIGVEIDGRFTIKSHIGTGGMGTVYLAWQHSIGREVALKIIKGNLTGKSANTKRFLREAKTASRLSHPNTVSVLDFGQTQSGLLYIVMELLQGKTLADLLREQGAFEWQRIVRIGTQICDALETAHRSDTVHRDLKPSNVIVLDDPPGRDLIKVLDFGLAKSLNSQVGMETVTDDGLVVGTLDYLAPELLAGGKATIQSDLYALGVVLYCLANGRVPYAASNVAQLQAKTEEPAPHSTGLPPVLDNTITRLLQRRPEDRWQSAALVREALVASRDTIQQNQESVSSMAEPEPTAAKNRARPLALTVAVAVGALAAIAYVVAHLGQPGPSDPVKPPSKKPAVEQPLMVDKKPVPAVKPAKQVTLKLVSRPVATVAVNDVEIGQTPIVYSAVQGEGKVRVTFTKKGFVSVTQEVSLERSEEVNIALHRKKAARQKRDSKPPF